MRLSLPSIYASGAPRDLHSFPTRRSSDLRFHLLGLEKLLLQPAPGGFGAALFGHVAKAPDPAEDRKSTRLNSSHLVISYAVFCLKKKKRSTSRKIRRLNTYELRPPARTPQ